MKLRPDDKGTYLKRSLLGSVQDFIETERKKSPSPPPIQKSRTLMRKTMVNTEKPSPGVI